MLNYQIRHKITASDLKILNRIVFRNKSYTIANLITNKAQLSRLLDDSNLYHVLITNSAYPISTQLFFYILARHALLKNGIDSYELSDYIGTILCEFGAENRYLKIKNYDDCEYQYLMDINNDLYTANYTRKFFLAQHLGNYSLWMSGLYPEYIINKFGSLSYYDSMSIRGFKMASVHPIAKEYEIIEIFEQLIDSYIMIRRALNKLRTSMNFQEKFNENEQIQHIVQIDT